MTKPPSIEEYAALQKALDAAQSQRDAVQSERDSLAGENRLLRVQRDLLQEKLNKMMRKVFGASSEVLGTHQKDMFFNEAEALAAATKAAPAQQDGDDDSGDTDIAGHKRAKRGRKPLDAALPRHVVRHELSGSDRICAHDGATLVEIGVEASEQLDIIPQQVRVIRHERVKYACPCCDKGLRLADKPAQIIPKGLFSEAALAWIATSKFDDGLPLYRQAALLGRFGGTDLSHNTMAASIVRVGAATQPVINLMRDHLLDSPLVFGDETTVQVLKEPGRAAQAKSYMWVQMTQGSGPEGTGPPIRLFGYSPSRSTDAAVKLYAGLREGAVLMTDGYEVYDKIERASGLVHLGCWAHARRYMVDALQALPKNARGPQQPAVQFVELIAKLYAVESRARKLEMDVQQRLHQRQEHSVPVIEAIKALLLAHLHAVVPGSALGKALHYFSSQWPKLVRYVQDGRYPIDNNPCENSIRPFVVGRKSWLFSDTVAGANASANLYSLVQTCKANGIDPYRYLSALFIALPSASTVDEYEALLPWRIALPEQ
ncbi:MAG: IS66 family transposase [Polaromonas sp.]